MILFIAIVLGIGAALVAYGTIAKNRWGINLNDVSCLDVGSAMPKLRTPRSGQQALWGGGTCAVCGAEVDKWGRVAS